MVQRTISDLRNHGSGRKVMDTTEEYIVMCRKAIDLQDSWKPDYYDYVFKQASRHQQVMCIVHRLQLEAAKKGEEAWQRGYIWLPRQDQLQKLVSGQSMSLRMLAVNFGCYCEKYGDKVHYYTMEQLWLAYVMEKLYHKAWDEGAKSWVKEVR